MNMKPFSQILLATALAASAFLNTGCGTVALTGRSQLNFIPEGQEMQLGLSSFDSLKKSTPISKDRAVNALVQKVGKRIADVTGKDMPNAQWEFVVFESKEANAFCLPGGKVGVYTGILPITKDEAGLATVIGHEVAHAVAKHGAERMSQGLVAQYGGQIIAGQISNAQYQSIFNSVYPVGSQALVLLPNSRGQESEADHMGLIYMARAGYDPEASVQFWQRFSEFNKANGGSTTMSFMRTHPTDETRIKQLQGWLPEAKKQLKAQ